MLGLSEDLGWLTILSGRSAGGRHLCGVCESAFLLRLPVLDEDVMIERGVVVSGVRDDDWGCTEICNKLECEREVRH